MSYLQRQLDSADSGGVSAVAVLRQGFRIFVISLIQTPMDQTVRKTMANSERCSALTRSSAEDGVRAVARMLTQKVAQRRV